MFKECYALEKIHGTSAHVSWKHESKQVILFSGGEKHAKFAELFDVEKLAAQFKEEFEHDDITLFGEAYGGKCQGMSETYGKELKFIVFDVKIGPNWLDVPNAEGLTEKFGLEFVHYNKINTDLKSIDAERDAPSMQAGRVGCGNDKMREGVVLRPLIELTKNNGNRIIVKHKGDDFKETKTKREVDPVQLKVLEDADEIANEWVTSNRLSHVLDKLGNPIGVEHIKDVIIAMVEDVFRESEGEIIKNGAVRAAISKASAKMYKKRIKTI